MWSLTVITLAALPLIHAMHGPRATGEATVTGNSGDGGLRAAVKNALADRSNLLLHAGFRDRYGLAAAGGIDGVS
jgi:hypothetical protein